MTPTTDTDTFFKSHFKIKIEFMKYINIFFKTKKTKTV